MPEGSNRVNRRSVSRDKIEMESAKSDSGSSTPIGERAFRGVTGSGNPHKPSHTARRGQKIAVTGMSRRGIKTERIQKQSRTVRTKAAPKKQRTPTAGKGNTVGGKIVTKVRRIARKIAGIPHKVKRALE